MYFDKTLIGLDLSVAKAGLVVARGSHILRATTLKCNLLGNERLRWWKRKVRKIARKYKPYAFCIEEYAYSRGKSRAHATGEVGGVVRLALAEAGYRVLIIPIGTSKKNMTGKGNTQKSMMVKEVFKRTKGLTGQSVTEGRFDASDDDVADGYALQWCGQRYFSKDDTKLAKEIRKKCELLVPLED